MEFKVACLFILLAFIRRTLQQYAAAQCLATSTTGAEFELVFRLNPNNINTITGVQFFDASESVSQTPVTDSGCSTSTLQEGVFKLSLSVLSGQTPCGLVKTGQNYLFAVCVKGSSKRCYKITCDTNNLQSVPTEVSETDYGTLHPGLHKEFGSLPVDVQFDVFENGGTNAPISEAKLGDSLKLNLIYNRGFEEKGATNWGYNFHTSFMGGSSDPREYTLEIVTPGLGTLVDIEVGNSRWTRKVFVKRNNAAYVTIPSDYITGNYDTTEWEVKEEAIKISAHDDRIGVRAVTVQGSTAPVPVDSHVVLPDELLGSTYKVNTGSRDSVNGEIVMVFKETTSNVRFLFSNTDIPTNVHYSPILAHGLVRHRT